MRKALVLLGVLGCLLLVLTGCGGPTEEEQARANVASPSILTVGASTEPSAKILNDPVRKQLEALGYELNVEIFRDAADANQALANRELDAVYLEHEPYLQAYNSVHGNSLVALGAVHFEPMGLYSTSCSSLEALPDGTTVALPNDPANRGRALLLLEQAGLISLQPTASHDATQNDVADNPKDLVFVEVGPKAIDEALEEGDLAALSVSDALAAELSPDEALASESPTAMDAVTYATVLVVRAATEQEPKIVALADALTSQATWNFITATYNGAVVPQFTVETSPSLRDVGATVP